MNLEVRGMLWNYLGRYLAAAILAGWLMTTSAMAEINYSMLWKMHADVQYGTMSLGDIDTSITKVGFGLDFKFNKSFTGGVIYDFYIPSDSTVDSPFDIGLEVGYTPIDKVKITGSLAYGTDNSNSYGGVLFGLGAKYQIIDYVAAIAEVKTGSMSPIAGSSFTQTTATTGLEFNFLKADGSYRW